MLGFPEGSWAYHSDDGNIFYTGSGDSYGPPFEAGDTVGCGVDVESGYVFFTKEGAFLGKYFLASPPIRQTSKRTQT
jgi:hypothetical protein